MSDTELILHEVRSLRSYVARVLGLRVTRGQLMKLRGIGSRSTLAKHIKTGVIPQPGRDGKWLLADLIDTDVA